MTNTADKNASSKYTYLDCLTDKCAAPAAGVPGRLFFTLLMAGSMCTLMTTFNGLRHHDWNLLQFFIDSHWMYPLVVPLAMIVRIFIADKIAAQIISKLIKPNFSGAPKAILIALANTSLMTPLMTVLITVLLQGFDNFGANYLEALPIAWAFAVVMNYLVVSPAVKLLHYNVISSTKGMHLMWMWARVMRPVTALFN